MENRVRAKRCFPELAHDHAPHKLGIFVYVRLRFISGIWQPPSMCAVTWAWMLSCSFPREIPCSSATGR